MNRTRSILMGIGVALLAGVLLSIAGLHKTVSAQLQPGCHARGAEIRSGSCMAENSERLDAGSGRQRG